MLRLGGSMNLLERLLIRMGGYPPVAVEADSLEDREPLIKLGWSVMLAVFVAAASWSTAGWVYSKGAPSPVQCTVLVACAILGGGVVLTLDRSFVFFVDTAVETSKGTIIVYTALRVVFVLLVGSITAQAVMPIIMGKELAAHALHMREASEAERLTKLGSQYELASKKDGVADASTEVKRLEDAASTLPPPIQQLLAAARACWVEYGSRKIAFVSGGNVDPGATELLALKAAECNRGQKTANNEADSYRKRIQAQLDAAVATKSQAIAQLSDANAIVRQKMERARVIEDDAISPNSSTVLGDLLLSNPPALMKWAVVTLILLLLELMPLIVKFQAGQSNIGHRIATSRAVKKLRFGEQLARAKYDAAVANAIAEVSRRGVADAAETHEVRTAFAQVFAANLAAYAPTQAVESMMNEFATRQYDVDYFMRRFPRYASVIALAWSNAIHETTEILTNGVRGVAVPVDQQPS